MSTKHATAEAPLPLDASAEPPAEPPSTKHAMESRAVRILRSFFNPSQEFAGLDRLDRDELAED